MASTTRNDDDELITSINVTPLVDITLVLLVILMITASYVLAKTIPMELPKGSTGEQTPTTLAVSIDAGGKIYLDATEIPDADLRTRIRASVGGEPDARAIIAADGRTPHARVIHVIDVLRRENVTKFAINVEPDELERN
jgi:biopolymer transport protein ExbD